MPVDKHPLPVLGLPWERGERPALTGAWWARALTLAERIAAPGAPSPAVPGSPDGDRAARRLSRWRTAYPEVTDDAVAPVLAGYGIDEQRLLDLLAEPADELAARAGKPAWAARVERVVGAMAYHGVDRTDDWRDAFAAIVAPFVADAADRLAGRVEYTGAPDVDGAALLATFRAALGRQLVDAASRILVLELNVMRLADRLSGPDAAARFWSFAELLADPAELAALLDEYAVLGRTLATLADQAVEAYAEFLGRFAHDRAALVERLLDGEPGTLVEVAMGGGDSHERGRSVAVLRFASGARLVYKPRPLALHQHVNDILAWYSQRLPDAALRRVRVLSADGYGWTEFVPVAECADPGEARGYFRRQGALLALLYVLAAVDFHYENVIACGADPVVVDLESVFHGDLPVTTGAAFTDGDPAMAALRDSVSRTGLLPAVLYGPDGGVLDVGGMGGDKGGVLPFKSVTFDAAGTDEMRLVRDYREFPGSQNRPTLAGRDLDVREFAAELLAGFRAGYRALAAHRDQLAGLIERCAADETRCIVRATRNYMLILTESSHPDVGRDALDRERVFGLLWAASVSDPARLRLVGAELTDLWHGDVPLFRTRAGSTDLYRVDGGRIAEVLPESGLARARRVLDRLGEADLAEQEWVIEATLATRAETGHGTPSRSARTAVDPAASVQERALAHARAIGDRLADSAYRRGDRVGWLGMDLVQDTQWTVTQLRADLYNGYPGVAVFLAGLAHLTGRQRYAELARAALRPLPAQVEHVRPLLDRDGDVRGVLGPYSGPTGVAYALASAARLLDDAELAAPVPGILDWVTGLVERDETLDIIGGAAGCLALAESLLDAGVGGTVAARLAAACAARLIDTSVPVEGGIGWYTMDSGAPLVGFSHGAAGIGWALLRYAARTGDAAARAAGRAALAYERTLFRPELDNWPDLRQLPDRPWARRSEPVEVAHMHAWCHGAPGIGLARAALPAGERDIDTDTDLARAVRSTAVFGHFGNHSICHGDLGNLELFSVAARAGVTSAAGHRESLAAAVLAHLDRVGPRCGTPSSVPTPGLMTGLSGIGHGLLRLAAPDRIAPVLLLAVRP